MRVVNANVAGDRAAVRRASIIPLVVRQHAEEAALAGSVRGTLTHAPLVSLEMLGRFDERIAAHLDGLAVASDDAWPFCDAALEDPSPGVIFTAAVRAIEERSRERLDRIIELSENVPPLSAGLISAFGWLEARQLQGTVVSLLGGSNVFRRMVGVAACAMHRVDPGLMSARRLEDPDNRVRARSLRAAGELGCHEGMRSCTAAIQDDDCGCRFWGTWSAVLLGNREAALEALTRTALAPGAHRARAFRLALQAMTTSAAHRVLQDLASRPEHERWVIQGSGIAGDSAYVPWLIKQMSNDRTARLAGEAFSLMTGADLANGLDRPQPENVESGPNDDSDDPNVDIDPDDGLPWPDAQRLEAWWTKNAGRFAKGTRYFMGEPVSRKHCIDVLKHGYQRQRILAAHYMCLLDPGTPLFNTSAPAWRQKKLLAQRE